MKLYKLHTLEFYILLFIVFIDVASLNFWELFDGEAGVRVNCISESIRTFFLHWFIYYLLSLNPIKDKRVQKATYCVAHAMVYYALAYVIKEIIGIYDNSVIDWLILFFTVIFWIVKYYGVENIKKVML